MPSDIRLEDVALVLEADHRIDVKAADLVLDQPLRRRPGAGGLRRALVHNQNDGLTINFNGDYPGGVVIQGKLRIDLRTPQVTGGGSNNPFDVPPVVLIENVFEKLQEEGSPEADLSQEIRRLRRAVVELNERLKQLESPTG